MSHHYVTSRDSDSIPLVTYLDTSQLNYAQLGTSPVAVTMAEEKKSLLDKHTTRETCSRVTVLIVGSLLLGIRWLFIVDFYGDPRCPTQRQKPMCYCTYFNDSWSCPEKGHQLDKKFSFGYLDGHRNLTNSSSNGRRLVKYLLFSIVEDACRSVVVIILLITRIYAVCRPESWSKGESECWRLPEPCDKTTKTVITIKRDKSTSKELDLQWKIAVGFLGGAFVHRMVALIMLQECDKPTEGGLQQANAVFKIIFMCTAGKIHETQTCLCPCNDTGML